MESKESKSISYYMRSLHRDIGFFVIGLTIIYSISGILLVYRDTNFMKSETQIEKQLSPGMKSEDLGKALHLRNFEVLKTEADVVYFKNGTYDKSSGIVKYTDNALPAYLEALNSFHKTSSGSFTHLLSVVFAVLLLFLAVSSFWIIKVKNKSFSRGITLASIGFICAMIFLII